MWYNADMIHELSLQAAATGHRDPLLPSYALVIAKVIEVDLLSDADSEHLITTTDELISHWKAILHGRPGTPGLRGNSRV
jgi:hypothetical protein